MKNLVCVYSPDVVIKISEDDAKKIGINLTGSNRGHMETVGPWQIMKSFKALCCNTVRIKGDFGLTEVKKVEFFGPRKMSNIKSLGYGIDGRVSVNGVKYSCFDSSKLFEVNGKLINVATIEIRA